MTNPGFGLTIDTGEISAGLSGVYGAGKAWTDQRTLKNVISTHVEASREDFGAYVDSRARYFAHVYEYRPGGAGPLDVIPGKSGRLWHLVPVPAPDGVMMQVTFEDSKNPSNPSELLIGKHPMMSSHIFADKAAHLETRQKLKAKAGRTRHTERTRERPPGPPSPLIWEEGGDIKYAMYRSWQNEFYGRFEEAFQKFWLERVELAGDRGFAQFAAKMEVPVATSVARPIVQVMPMSIPKPAVPGVIKILDAGKYSGGRLSLSSRYIRQAFQSVQKHMVKGTKWLT